MMNRRELLKALPVAGAAGALFALSGRTLGAEIPAMSKASQADTTPEKAIKMLKDGNARFINGKNLQRNLMAEVRATASGQFPFAVVLGCIDSRVPPNLSLIRELVISLVPESQATLQTLTSSAVSSSPRSLRVRSSSLYWATQSAARSKGRVTTFNSGT